MNKFFPFIYFLLSMVVVGCGNNNYKQHSIFPLPCVDKQGNPYYIDENGDRMEDLEETISELDVSGHWLPDFFMDEVVRVDLTRDNTRICQFLDDDGDVVLDVYNTVFKKLFPGSAEKAFCTDFSDGIAFVTADTTSYHSYAINKKGDVVFELDGHPITGFNQRGRGFFKNAKGEIGVIASNGQVVMEPRKSIVANPHNLPPRRGIVNVMINGRYGLMTYNGNTLTCGISDAPLIPDRNGCIVIYDKRKDTYGIATKHGEVICMTDYKYLVNDGKLYYFINRDNRVGWCDKNGKTVIPPIGKSKNQIADSKYFDLPRPFYGANRSVVTVTYKGKNGTPEYLSAGLNVDNLRNMKGALNIKNTVHPSDAGIMISPFVEKKILIWDMSKRANLYVSQKGGLYKAGNALFEPRYGYDGFDLYGEFAIRPISFWKGFDKRY